MLLINNYTYNKENDEFLKKVDDAEFKYYLDWNEMAYGLYKNYQSISIYYDINRNSIDVKVYDYIKNKNVVLFNYYLDDNKLNCQENCADYEKYLKIILDEYQKIVEQ